MVNYQIKTLKTNEVRKHGVDELWVSVLARAVEDALKVDEYGNDLDRRSARYWFRSYSVDFRLVCELAGRNPRYVREKMLRKIGDGENTQVPTRNQIKKEIKEETNTKLKINKLWNLERAWKQVKSLKYAQYQKPYNERRHEYN